MRMPELLAESAWDVPAGAYVCFLIAVAVFDVRYRRIPNSVVYPAIVCAVAIAFVRPGGAPLLLLSGFLAGGLLVLLGLLSRGGMGMGDAKLAAFVGLVSGWPGTLVALLVAFVTGAVGGVVLIGTGRKGRRDPIPFGPSLAIGGLTALVAGPQLARLFWPALG
jgi:prepilin signal peptidase PulO-like enzyme (type II secretory pathway)